MLFSERYSHLRTKRASVVRESSPELVSEHLVQCIWYDRLFKQQGLSTEDGRGLKIISPGWWNHGEGPDFKGAQIEFNGRLRTGDVEIHISPSGWNQHGHNLDQRYDEVMLNVVLDKPSSAKDMQTSEGLTLPLLTLSEYLESEILDLAEQLKEDSFPRQVEGTFGRCSSVVEAGKDDSMREFVHLAGEWRMLFKAREIRERTDRIGGDKAVYEMFMYACGFSHFKQYFKAVARQLPYERVRQLGQDNALLLESAMLHISGLFPEDLPEGTKALPHVSRLRGFRNTHLDGLRAMPLTWKRVAVRPVNYPERRIAGAARFLSKTSIRGLSDTLNDIWKTDYTPLNRRKAFEDLFPGPMGFWSTHCTWTGKDMTRPSAPIGGGRVRSIIGNVFVPMGLAMARDTRDRAYEDRVMEFFAALPKEPENRIQKIMLPRVYGNSKPQKLDFRTQQGLIQMYQDWCEPNPSCKNCQVMTMLNTTNPTTSTP
jgi:hypothetical protein